MPYDKLYIRIACLTCDGKRMMDNGPHHDPLNPTMWKECPYCDHEGYIIIEASKESITKHLRTYSLEDRRQIVRDINDDEL
jgi:hypothetical protein